MNDGILKLALTRAAARRNVTPTHSPAAQPVSGQRQVQQVAARSTPAGKLR